MRNSIPQTIVKILVILAVIALVVVLIIAYTNMFKNLKGGTSNQETPTTASQPEQAAPVVSAPVEAQIGSVMDVSIQPDGKIQLIVDKKTYLFPSDQTVNLYTSSTQTTSIPMSQLTKGTIVNVMRFTNPQQYKITGTTDKGLIEKLL